METLMKVIESVAAAIEALLNSLGLATPDFVKDILSDAKDKIEDALEKEEA